MYNMNYYYYKTLSGSKNIYQHMKVEDDAGAYILSIAKVTQTSVSVARVKNL